MGDRVEPAENRPFMRVVSADARSQALGGLVGDPPDPDARDVVLLLHDIDANAMVWAPVVRRLVAQGRSVLAPDLRGRGASFGLWSTSELDDTDPEWPHWRDIAGFLDRFGVHEVLVVGHGWGSDVGLTFASNMIDRVVGVVAIDPSVRHVAPERLLRPISSREELGEFWVARASGSGCLEDDARRVAEHDLEGGQSGVRLRIDRRALERDRWLDRPAVTPALLETIRSAHELASTLDGGADPLVRIHDVPLLDHLGVIMSPNGTDVVLAAIDRADRRLGFI